MTEESALPADDLTRQASVIDADDPRLTHLGVVGDTYTVLLTGDDTAGRYSLIDMLVPPGGGPPAHRHDFEEMFHVLDGQVEITFRGETSTAHTGQTVNIPARAPHQFRNASDRPARLLCLTTPSGLDRMFVAIGDRLPTRLSPAPVLSRDELERRIGAASGLAAELGMESMPPG
ncbi:MAG: cupin domain-containing protein [Pseudonocardia sp.]|nr:cupin domain-containing protein [Pseudonocardia sp.]